MIGLNYRENMSKILLAGVFIVLNSSFLSSAMAKPKPNSVAEATCASYIQKKVVWDSSDKNRAWSRKDIIKLCKGVKTGTIEEPGICHTAVQRGNAWKTTRNIKGQKSWGAIQVASLCGGASDGMARMGCFERESAINGMSRAMNKCKKLN